MAGVYEVIDYIEESLRKKIEARRQGHTIDFRDLYGCSQHEVFIAMLRIFLDRMAGV